MSDLSTRLKQLLDDRNLSMNAFAKQLGVSQPSISDIVNGRTRSPKNILEIATALGVNPHWLKTGEGEPDSDVVEYVPKAEENALRVDVMDYQAAAHSSGIVNVDYPDIVESIFFTAEGLFKVLGRKSAVGIKIFKVPTDSLAPTIKPSDLVFVDTHINNYVAEGIYVFNLNGETYIKRLQRLPTGVIRALSDNPLYPPFEITDELFDTAEIIGKFLAVLPFEPKLL
nr:helix-turn-helix transcriptional regulator [uncultured Haemophilus sp.]DAK32617.1 MAG TPA: Repressor protein CI [Caudoviricetes sp.]